MSKPPLHSRLRRAPGAAAAEPNVPAARPDPPPIPPEILRLGFHNFLQNNAKKYSVTKEQVLDQLYDKFFRSYDEDDE
jgi:hypothetical protein